MDNTRVYVWLFVVVVNIQLASCTNSMKQRDIVKELREIKREMIKNDSPK